MSFTVLPSLKVRTYELVPVSFRRRVVQKRVQTHTWVLNLDALVANVVAAGLVEAAWRS